MLPPARRDDEERVHRVLREPRQSRTTAREVRSNPGNICQAMLLFVHSTIELFSRNRF